MRAGSRSIRGVRGSGERFLPGVTHDPANTLPPVADSSSALGGQADERELLTGYLDWYRSVVEGKVADLSLQDASRIMTPTGLSPLGIVKHLSDVEQSWFRERFAGEEIDTAWSDDDPLAVFRIEPGETVASTVAFCTAVDGPLTAGRGRRVPRRGQRGRVAVLRARLVTVDPRARSRRPPVTPATSTSCASRSTAGPATRDGASRRGATAPTAPRPRPPRRRRRRPCGPTPSSAGTRGRRTRASAS